MKLRFSLRELARAYSVAVLQPQSRTRRISSQAQQDLLNNPDFQKQIKDIRTVLKKKPRDAHQQLRELLRKFDLSPIGTAGIANLLLTGEIGILPGSKDVGRIKHNWGNRGKKIKKTTIFDEIEAASYPVTIDIAAHASFSHILKYLEDNREAIEGSLRLMTPAAKAPRNSRIHSLRDEEITRLRDTKKLSFEEIVEKIKHHASMQIRNTNFDITMARAAYRRAKKRGRTER